VNHCFRVHSARAGSLCYRPRKAQRGVTAYAVILTVAILAILSHNLVHQALMDYHQGALVRDTIALQQLTDSALSQVLYYINHDDRTAATAAIRESFGVASIELSDAERSLVLRIVADAPNAAQPRTSSRTVLRLERDAPGPWRVVAAESEPIPLRR